MASRYPIENDVCGMYNAEIDNDNISMAGRTESTGVHVTSASARFPRRNPVAR